MPTHRITISLEEADLLALWAAIVDDDGEAALDFLRQRVLPQVPSRGTAPCDSSRLNPYLLPGGASTAPETETAADRAWDLPAAAST